MKRWYTGLFVVLIIVFASGCTGESPSSSSDVENGTYTSGVLSTDYENALTVRNQLALGLLSLRYTDNEISPEEAAALLPLWQALRNTSRNGISATSEVDALLGQIEDTLTPSQLQAIQAMQLTQADLAAWAEDLGLAFGNLSGGNGMGGAGQGQGQGLSEEERAARQAENGGSGAGGGGINAALVDELILYLEHLR